MRQLILLGAAALLIGPMQPAAATSVQPLEDIREAARRFVVAETAGGVRDIEVTVGRLDPRLRLARCSVPLAAYFSAGARALQHTTVGVRCEGAQPWTLFVQATITEKGDVVVSSRPLARGQIVTAADVGVERRALLPGEADYFTDPQVVIGMVLTRPTPGATPLSTALLKAPRLVRRGQRVQLAWTNGIVAVRMSGTALRDGIRGDRIPVENLNSKRIIEGTVDGPGSVIVRQGPDT